MVTQQKVMERQHLAVLRDPQWGLGGDGDSRVQRQRGKRSPGGLWVGRTASRTALPPIRVSHWNSLPSGGGRERFCVYLWEQQAPWGAVAWDYGYSQREKARNFTKVCSFELQIPTATSWVFKIRLFVVYITFQTTIKTKAFCSEKTETKKRGLQS